MRALLLSATAIAAFLAASPLPGAQAQQGWPSVTTNPSAIQQLTPKVRCEVYAGVHIAFQNIGTLPIPAGTKVQWSLPSGAVGNYALGVTLNPTAWVLRENALRTPVRSRDCSAVVI